ncbi:MAG: 6-hydroxymethylpterin diphosphokinase MptE-like protein [Chlamydiota bacterium]|nr:6-hydroxymethylpterin diphosphokinase MptE-like protein [Chlamydiota bacterium]
MKDVSEKFNTNYERWIKVSQNQGEEIRTINCENVVLCKSENGLQNLKKDIDGEIQYYHDPKDPIAEAKTWFSTLSLEKSNLIFVYGIGLGYYYEAVVEWLSRDKNRHLVFIEDDAEVMHRFLGSDYAERILHDTQVQVYYLNTFDKSVLKFDKIVKRYTGSKHKISANKLYLKHKSSELMRMNNMLAFLMKVQDMVHEEYRKFSVPFFLNYYLNLLSLPDSYLAKPMWNKFKNVPAIICGAGPSLNKNIDVLKQLQSKALIFGGSTSVNALNAAGINPHFGVGIDPNFAQMGRIVSNQAFQTPYFLNFRMNSFALNAIHGDHLYVNGAATYEVADWIDEQLGIEGKAILEGYNVINYALSIAFALGCNPITIVGVDLAYSDDKSYAKLTPEHPLYSGIEKFQTKTAEEDLVARKDIHGNQVFTLWKWLLESVWYSKYAMQFPKLDIINASEGGIGFPGVENTTLQEVADSRLTEDFDFSGMIHSNIQSLCQMPENVSFARICEILDQLKDSMVKGKEYCANVVEEYVSLMSDISEGKDYSDNLLTEKITKNVCNLDEEVAYRYILTLYMRHLTTVLKKEVEKLELDKEWLSAEELDQELVQIHSTRFEFVMKAASSNTRLIENALNVGERHDKRKSKYPSVEQNQFEFRALEKSIKEKYHSKGDTFTIFDPALGIDIKGTFSKGDGLNGPSRFYHENGQLLSETWFYMGKKVGRSETYYPSGKCYSITHYVDGNLHGPQDYYFEDGKRRSHLNYKNGVLDGPVYLFYENGQLKREIFYNRGKRSGAEILWSYDGKKIGVVEYVEDKPVGTARFWSSEGVVQKEVSFDEEGNIKETKYWDKNGNLINLPEGAGMDYFDLITLKMEAFTNNLKEIADSLDKITPFILRNQQKSEVIELQKEMKFIHNEIDNLLELNKKMRIDTGMDSGATSEAIWKTPSMQDMVQKMMDKVTTSLKKQIDQIQTAFIDTVEALVDQGTKKES